MLTFIILGAITGSVYGLAGVGLVLTYKTSGVFNFAHGVLATIAAYAFYWLATEHGLPWPVAALIAAGVFGAIIGFGLEFLARYLAKTTLAWRIAATLGLVLTVEAGLSIIQGSAIMPMPHYLPLSTVDILGARATWEQVITLIISVVSSVGLWLFFRTARLGKSMRAVVDDPVLLGLTGANPAVVRRWAWIIGSVFATLSGLLLSPGFSLNSTDLTLLIVQAFGAAAIGRFSNLPLTWTGGVLIGIVASLITGYVHTSSSYLAGLAPSVPFLVLFLVILFASRDRDVLSHGAMVRLASTRRPAALRRQILPFTVALALLCTVPGWAGVHMLGWTIALTYVILVLSLGLLVRSSGQISLCQVGFAAVGAVAFSKFAHGTGIPWLVALILAGLVVMPIGALLAIPAIRLSPLYLALATFGFGLLLQDMFYQSNLMFGVINTGLPMPMPHLGWVHLDTTRGFYYVVLAVLVALTALFIALPRGRLGRLVNGISSSPTVLMTSGAETILTHVIVFCVAAFVAAIGGALLGMLLNPVSGASYPPLTSLTLFVLVMITPGDVPWYALVGGLGLGVVPSYVTSAQTSNYLNVIFGLSAIVAATGFTPKVPTQLAAALGRMASAVRLDALLTRTPTAIPRPAASIQTALIRRDKEMEFQAEGVRVQFGGLVAVNDVSISARTGRITGLIGPNGAGKSSLLNACSGIVTPARGTIWLNGGNISRASISKRARLGLGRTFQQVQLLEALTVFDNVAMGYEAGQAGADLVAHIVSRRSELQISHDRAHAALSLCGIDHLSDVPVGSLSTGQRRIVELARCLAGPFGILLLDEPAAGLDPTETEAFGQVLRRSVDESGIGVLIVEHDMRLVLTICDEILVLDFGAPIFRGTPQEVAASPQVQLAYLGAPSVSADSSQLPPSSNGTLAEPIGESR